MGILDDAIREHLELKKSHGASQDEITRQEAEVFGPIRQEVAPQAEAVPAPEAAPAPEAVEAVDQPQPVPEEEYEVHPGDHAVPDPHHEGEPGGSDPAWGDDTELFAEPAQQAAPHQEVHHEEERHPALTDTDEHFQPGHEPPEPVFEHQGQEPPVAEPAAAEPPAAEPDVAEPGEDEDEDVLEDTPEFLQDAPEHDRLWFEQKPPRDFDFGE